jgi:hypothetical protein
MSEHFTPRIRPASLDVKAAPQLRRVAEELFDIGDAYERTGDESSGRANAWKQRGDVLATTVAVLAATSGIIGLAWKSDVVAATLALIAAATSAVLATLHPAERASRAKSYADACWEVTGEVRDLLIEIPDMRTDDAAASLSRVRARAQRVSRRSLDVGSSPMP